MISYPFSYFVSASIAPSITDDERLLNIISPRWGYKTVKVAYQHQSLSFQANKKNPLK